MCSEKTVKWNNAIQIFGFTISVIYLHANLQLANHMILFRKNPTSTYSLSSVKQSQLL